MNSVLTWETVYTHTTYENSIIIFSQTWTCEIDAEEEESTISS